MKSTLRFLLVFALSIVMIITAEAKGKDKKESNNISVQGQVIDKSTGETLAGVVVKIDGTNIQATTDLDGNFVINNLNPGEYKLYASYISYKDDVVTINVAEKSSKVVVALISR